MDREAKWVSSKPRDFDRSHGRNQAERPSMRPDRLAAPKNQEVRKWESNMHEPLASYHGHSDSFSSTNSSHNLGMYPQTAFSSDAVSPSDPTVPPVVLMCPYDQGAGYGLPAEPLEFGSLRPVHLSSGNGAPRVGDRITEGGPYDRNYSSFHRGGSRSSPDQPSSP